MKQRNRLVGKFLCADYRLAPILKFGISASKRYGNSPERNRFKRLVREAFRLCQNRFPQNFECNILPRQRAKRAKLQDIQEEICTLFNQLKSHAQ